AADRFALAQAVDAGVGEATEGEPEQQCDGGGHCCTSIVNCRAPLAAGGKRVRCAGAKPARDSASAYASASSGSPAVPVNTRPPSLRSSAVIAAPAGSTAGSQKRSKSSASG